MITPLRQRFDPKLSEEQARKIAEACLPDRTNVREVQGEDITTPKSTKWRGDHLGSVAEGLSRGKIQIAPRT